MSENIKKNKKRNLKIRNLILVCVMTALLLTVGTYAWFIGMQTVKVNEFTVDISSVDSLLLSMDGKKWSTSIKPDDTENYPSYENNENEFLKDEGEGLKPISSVGVFNKEASKLELFEKGSLTATTGGYRLLASRVNNYDKTNTTNKTKYSIADGYVVFDLFVMNFSGDAYYSTVTDPSNEEAIYLTYESKVEAGAGTNAGVQNSVRVAFAQIGRVKASDYYPLADTEEDDAKQAVVTGMTCKPGEGSPVTGLCRDATIWEPNENTHIEAAKTWYNTTCKARLASEDGKKSFNYKATENACASLDNYITTNAVAGEIAATDYVDIYDGAYNTYTGTANTLLKQVDTFTDDEKSKTGVERLPFMTLAPNSITKIRVYIWIEGQDIDNFDFASLGNSIKVSFGFTKERITTGEIDPSIDPSSGPNADKEGFEAEQLPTA